MSNSMLKELLRYAGSRVPGRLYLPLALLLCTAGSAGGPPATLPHIARALLLAYTLLFQFRLWDDLADLPRDRVGHPQRVLPQTRHLMSFYGLTLLLFLTNLVLITVSADRRPHGLVFLLLNGFFAIWYLWRHALPPAEIARAHVGLTKYPAFILLLSHWPSGGATTPLLLSMALVYCCFGIYEILHDDTLRALRGARRLLAVEMASLNAVVALMAIALPLRTGQAALLQWALVPVCTMVLVALFLRQRAHTHPMGWSYAVFLLGFFGLLTFTMGLTP